MTDAEMRRALIKAYPGQKWGARVKKMTEAQVFATYSRLKRDNKI